MAEFKNPNQQGGQDNSSLLLMMLVMVAVIFGIQYYRYQKNPQTAAPSAPAATASQSAPAAPPVAAATPALAPPVTAASTRVAAVAIPTVQAAAESTTVVENELYRIEFSNRGGEVRSWILKRNPATGEAFTDNEGKPLDLVHDTAAQQFGYPLSLYTTDAGLSTKLRQALYVASAQGTLSAPATLSFSYADGTLKVTKTFTFDQTYVIHADVQIAQNGVPVRAALSWPGGFGDQESASAYNNSQIETMGLGRMNHAAVKKVSGGAAISGPLDMGGVSDPYFAAIFLPDQPETASLSTLSNQIDMARVKRKNGVGQGKPVNVNVVAGQPCDAGGKAIQPGAVCVPVLGAAIADASGHLDTRVFVGPKSMDVLKNIQTSTGYSLEPIINFGFWGFIGKYLFLALRFFHEHVAPNWGWSIILLTVVINLMILPLRVQSMKSAIKMQRIQPMVNALKAKYKNPKPTDPRAAEMNAEVMKLYKENNVNMFGGCLPSLIPIPLFIAFYGMLPSVVELRHAHWLWLHDLTQPDPTHILPILTIITMFLTSYLTPSPGVDPMQQKMMAFIMPVFFGAIVWTYGSGLALYWVTGSMISIAAQMVMNRTNLGQEMREIAAKRARRKGNTIQGKR